MTHRKSVFKIELLLIARKGGVPACTKKMYYTLFNAITTALDQLERGAVPAAVLTLKTAQMDAEDLFLDGEEPENGHCP